MDVLLTTADQIAGMNYSITISNVKDTPGMNIMTAHPDNFNGSSVEDAEKLTVSTLTRDTPKNSKI